jgi:hypothetical protein
MRYLVYLVCLLCWISFLDWGALRLRQWPKAPPARTVVSACLAPAEKQSLPHLVALRDMAVNWRVSAADLTRPVHGDAPTASEFVGKYLGCKIAGVDPVITFELRSNPQITVADKKLLYLLPLDATEESAINAGMHLDLFAGATADVTNAEVLAVVCKSSCEAVLQLTPAEIELLKLLDASKLKKIIR